MVCLDDADKDCLLKFVKSNGAHEYATSYVNLRLSALRTFYAWAYKNRLCSSNLILEYKKSKINHIALPVDENEEDSDDSITVLSPEEHEILLNLKPAQEFTAIRNKCIVNLILDTALYAEELINLQITSLDIKNGYIDIVDTNRERRVGVSTVCLQNCIDWLKVRESILPHNINCLFLFFTKSFERLTKRRLHTIISQYLINAGIAKKHLGADVLRQTSICNLFRNQKTIEEIQQITGIQTLARLERYRRTVVE